MKYINNCLQYVFFVLSSLCILLGFAVSGGVSSFEMGDKDKITLCIEHATLLADEDELSEIIEEFKGLLPEGLREEEPQNTVGRLGLDSLLEELLGSLGNVSAPLGGFFLLAVGLALISSLAEAMLEGFSDLASRGAVLLSGLALFGGAYPIIAEAMEAMAGISELFGAFIPTLTALISLGGGASVAGAQAAGMSFTLWLFGGLGTAFLGTVCAAMLVAGVTSPIAEGYGSFLSGVGGAFTKTVGIITAVVAGILSLQSFVASSADGAAVRAARYAASNLIPVVGNAVSGAMSTLSGGLSYAVGVVGGGAVAAIISLALSPLVMLLLYKLCLFLAGSLAQISGARGTAGFFSIFQKGFDALISVYALSTVIYLFEIILFLKSGVILL